MGIKGYNHPGRKHPVVSVNTDGSVVGYFEFIKEAAELYGCDWHSITDSCRRGTICRGLRWYYEEDFREIYMKCEFEKLKYTVGPNRDRKTYRFKKGHHFNGVSKRSEETRRKCSEISRRTCLRMKEAGMYALISAKRHKPCRCTTDGKEFASNKEAAAHYGIPPHYVSTSITRGIRVRGLRFERIERQEDTPRQE